ncbi:hypothetical protein AB4Y36_38120 [Paraburkholderia sp. BR10936]|uniref:hypothetical protein n=1 Tax=Paraburkholderia sp. BR10936 TaxID=3236993 RepID=UPI0034D1F5FB
MGGRPRFEPSAHQRELVKALLIYGVPLANICTHVLNSQTGKAVSYTVFVRAFNREIATAVDRGNAAVAANLYRIATKKADTPQVVQSAIFWMRTRGGWKLSEAAEAAPPPAADAPPMVENEETARAIMEDVLNKYGRRRLTG